MKKQNVRTLSFIVGSFTYLLIGAAIFESLESETEAMGEYELNRTTELFKKNYNITKKDFTDLEDMIVRYHSYANYPQW
jgi:hypothetical protein